MTDSRVPTAGSGNYIQNQNAAPQSSSNFNISGTGKGSIFDADSHYRILGNRVLSTDGTSNLFVGVGAGPNNTGLANAFVGSGAGSANTSGVTNSFFGASAGVANTSGSGNSFFGTSAGAANQTGNNNAFFGVAVGTANTASFNAFFGSGSGQSNTSGGSNSFFGGNAGFANQGGNNNAFFGTNAGAANTGGGFNSFFGVAAGQNSVGVDNNSFFGYTAGYFNTSGSDNAFFGSEAGKSNTDGLRNSFFGRNAGFSNSTASDNSFFGNAAGQNSTGGDNSFFGGFAGAANTTGASNSFFGRSAGANNTTDGENSFFGFLAGFLNSTGTRNSFFGRDAGFTNTTGNDNSFFGMNAGKSNAAGSQNAFFGQNAGRSNTIGNSNSAFGFNAGFSNTLGAGNVFFGTSAGENTTGSGNSFFGGGSGSNNTSGQNNTAIGVNANVGSGTLGNATAIGAGSSVSTSNTVALGRSNGSDQVLIPGNLVVNGSFNLPAGDADYIQNTTSPQTSSNFSISGNGIVGNRIGVGTANPVMSLDVRGSMVLDAGAIYTAASGGEQNRYVALINSPTTQTASGLKAGGVLVSDDYFYANPTKNNLIVKGNVGIGTTTPQSRLDVSTATENQGFSHTDGTIRLSSFVGTRGNGNPAGWLGTMSNHPLFFFTANGTGNPEMSISPGGTVSIGIGYSSTSTNRLEVNGTVMLDALGSAGGPTLCWNVSKQISNCSSSLRYKTNIGGFSPDMSFVNQLRPISYDWKDSGLRDVGFGAEDVEKIDPRFVTYNKAGEVEGVKYDRLSVAFVNAFHEQQKQIEGQQKLVESQQRQISEMKKLVCLTNKLAEICKE